MLMHLKMNITKTKVTDVDITVVPMEEEQNSLIKEPKTPHWCDLHVDTTYPVNEHTSWVVTPSDSLCQSRATCAGRMRPAADHIRAARRV